MAFTFASPVLPVRNVAVALARFSRLGFAAKAYGPAGAADPVYGFVSADKIELHLARVPELDPLANTSAVYLYCDDADALYAAWSRADVGGRFHAPEDTEYDLREFAYVDPDGNLLRVGAPLKR
jgi:hypothetical protein